MQKNDVAVSEEGYAQTLSSRQVTMIAIGGAIGVGLFMGAGSRMVSVGPALVISYIIAGIVGYFLMTAIGELIMYRRTSGSLVSYSGEFFGAKGAYISGWAYFVNWGMTGIAELIAIGLYIQNLLPDLNWFITSLIALVLLTSANLISVKFFGELEFWASVIKVAAIIIFLIVGTVLVALNAPIGNFTAGTHNLTAVNDSFFAHGVLPMVLVLSGVIFAYNGIEMIGVTAGEMRDAKREVPKAIRSVVFRIIVFYVGSVTLLGLLLPSDQYKAGVSPFVTVFENLGLGWAGTAMTLIVTTAALSSCNSGLYSIGRIFRTMAGNGHAPQWLVRMNSRHVPYASIGAISVFYFVGLCIAFVSTGGKGEGSLAFDLALETGALGVIGTWAAIFTSHIALRVKKGKNASELPARTGIVGSAIGLAVLALVVVLIGFSTQTRGDGSVFPIGLATLASVPVFAVILIVGWQIVKRTAPEKQVRSHYARDNTAVEDEETPAPEVVS